MSIVERIAHQDVQGFRIGRFTRAINTTCLFYRLGNALIDCGPPNQYRWVGQVAGEAPIRTLLLTHHHEDHGGNAARLSRSLGVEVLAPKLSLEPLANGFPVQYYRRIVWGTPPLVRAKPFPAQIDLEGAFSLQPISTPGHSTDMTCLLEPDRGWLFAGDLFVASRPRYLRFDEDVATQIQSLRKILNFEFDTLFCGHRGIVTDAKRRIQGKLDYFLELSQRVHTLKLQGHSFKETTRRLLGKEDFLSWFSGFHFSKRNLVQSCLLAAEKLDL